MIARTPSSTPAHTPPPPLMGAGGSHVPLRPGGNVRLGSNALGFWIEGPAGSSADFRHPWLVTASARGARIARGLILSREGAAVEPLVGKTPISGSADGKERAPVLQIDSSTANSSGESWVCVEVTPDADGRLDPEGKRSNVEVVQRATPSVMQGETGRAPLALLVFRNGRPVPQVIQIALFYFRYETSQRAGEPRKHFFL